VIQDRAIYSWHGGLIVSRIAVPLVRPVTVMVDVDSIRSTSARLFWRKVDLSPDKVRGFFRGYRVSVLLTQMTCRQCKVC